MKPKYLFALLVPAFIIYMMVKPEEPLNMNFISNTFLNTTAPSSNWNGTPIDSKGRFLNLYHPFEASIKDLLIWKLSKNPQKKEKENDPRTLPYSKERFDFQTGEDYIIWLGHASYLIQTNGLTFITDPMLLDNFFLKRQSELPFPMAIFPKIDYLLLSHNHRDHCDEASIKWLIEQNPAVKILTGLGMKEVISSWINNQEVQEAGWYQSYRLPIEELEIHFVPSRHWSKRWLNDDNKSLWGGFYLKSGEKSIYFMSDSGRGQHFEDIKNTFGAPQYCIMGIGAYKPEWFMYQSHISPLDAIDAFNCMEGRYLIPMHYGTFNLSDELALEPWDVISSNRNKLNGQLIEPILGINLIQKF